MWEDYMTLVGRAPLFEKHSLKPRSQGIRSYAVKLQFLVRSKMFQSLNVICYTVSKMYLFKLYADPANS